MKGFEVFDAGLILGGGFQPQMLMNPVHSPVQYPTKIISKVPAVTKETLTLLSMSCLSTAPRNNARVSNSIPNEWNADPTSNPVSVSATP